METRSKKVKRTMENSPSANAASSVENDENSPIFHRPRRFQKQVAESSEEPEMEQDNSVAANSGRSEGLLTRSTKVIGEKPGNGKEGRKAVEREVSKKKQDRELVTKSNKNTLGKVALVCQLPDCQKTYTSPAWFQHHKKTHKVTVAVQTNDENEAGNHIRKKKKIRTEIWVTNNEIEDAHDNEEAASDEENGVELQGGDEENMEESGGADRGELQAEDDEDIEESGGAGNLKIVSFASRGTNTEATYETHDMSLCSTEGADEDIEVIDISSDEDFYGNTDDEEDLKKPLAQGQPFVGTSASSGSSLSTTARASSVAGTSSANMPTSTGYFLPATASFPQFHHQGYAGYHPSPCLIYQQPQLVPATFPLLTPGRVQIVQNPIIPLPAATTGQEGNVKNEEDKEDNQSTKNVIF